MQTAEDIRSVRVQLDGMWRLTESLLMHGSGPVHYARYARESLLLSKLWLGKVIQAMGEPTPYPDSKTPGNEHIAPMADVSTVTDYIDHALVNGFDWKAATTVSRIKWMRSEIDKVSEKLPLLYEMIDVAERDLRRSEELMLALRCSKQYLIEAGMWFGMQLGAIRDHEQINHRYYKGSENGKPV